MPNPVAGAKARHSLFDALGKAKLECSKQGSAPMRLSRRAGRWAVRSAVCCTGGAGLGSILLEVVGDEGLNLAFHSSLTSLVLTYTARYTGGGWKMGQCQALRGSMGSRN